MTYKIYRIINEINGKSYIRIHQAIRKYGENSFCIELLDSGDFESGAWVPPLKGKKMSEESRRRLSESKTGKISYTKTYQVLFPDGHTEITANMAQFCRDRGLNKNDMFGNGVECQNE